jgi:hypothetical protein
MVLAYCACPSTIADDMPLMGHKRKLLIRFLLFPVADRASDFIFGFRVMNPIANTVNLVLFFVLTVTFCDHILSSFLMLAITLKITLKNLELAQSHLLLSAYAFAVSHAKLSCRQCAQSKVLRVESWLTFALIIYQVK